MTRKAIAGALAAALLVAAPTPARAADTSRLVLHYDFDGDLSGGVVKDTSGSGLDGTDLERLFEPFVTTKEHGLGVGLSISRAVVTAHGGRLWAETNGEGGATFHVSLPVPV